MIYADTNVLIALVCKDATSRAAERWIEEVDEPIALSDWTVIEFRSNIGLRVRKRLLSRQAGLAIMAEFDRLVGESMHALVPAPGHFRQASQWLASPACALRSADALHLAIARGHGCSAFATFDRPLATAARRLELPVQLLRE